MGITHTDARMARVLMWACSVSRENEEIEAIRAKYVHKACLWQT